MDINAFYRTLSTPAEETDRGLLPFAQLTKLEAQDVAAGATDTGWGAWPAVRR